MKSDLEYVCILAIIISALILPINLVAAEKPSVVLTPFSISFSEQDFTRSGQVHQILILKPNESATIHVKVHNDDGKAHEISFRLSALSRQLLPFSYSFEPPNVSVAPNSSEEVLLHIMAGDTAETKSAFMPVIAEGRDFGLIAKSFYLFIGSNVTDSDTAVVDKLITNPFPGPAFPRLNNKVSERGAEGMIVNKFGIPRYLPEGYKFRGMPTASPDIILAYAPIEVTNTTRSLDFWKSGGMLVLYANNEPGFNQTKWMSRWIESNEGQQVMINGRIGVATVQEHKVAVGGGTFNFPAEVAFFTKETMVELRGSMPLKELLNVAAAIPLPGTVPEFPIVWIILIASLSAVVMYSRYFERFDKI